MSAVESPPAIWFEAIAMTKIYILLFHGESEYPPDDGTCLVALIGVTNGLKSRGQNANLHQHSNVCFSPKRTLS